MIEELLDHRLGYFFCMGVPQAQFVSPSVQASSNSSRRHRFPGNDNCLPWGFEGHPLNLDKGPSGDDYGHPLNSEWNSGHSWSDCGNIHLELFWYRYCLFRGWGRYGSQYN